LEGIKKMLTDTCLNNWHDKKMTIPMHNTIIFTRKQSGKKSNELVQWQKNVCTSKLPGCHRQDCIHSAHKGKKDTWVIYYFNEFTRKSLKILWTRLKHQTVPTLDC
jgi:hypothetical protein